MRIRPLALSSVLLLALDPALAKEDIAFLGLSNGYWEVWLLDAETRKARQLTHYSADVSRVSWYPDRQHVLVNRHDGRWQRVAIRDGHGEDITPPLPGIVDGVLSPDGQRIAFSLSTGGSIDDNDIWLFEPATKQQRKLTQMPRLQHEPAWAPDGRYVYFLSGDGGQAHDIWRVEVASSSTEQLTVESLYHFDLAIGRDGRLAFSSNRSGNYEIWWQPPKDTAVALTNDDALDARPSWSPDESQLVFESTRDGDSAIYRLDMATKRVERLSPKGQSARMPVWAQSTGDKQ